MKGLRNLQRKFRKHKVIDSGTIGNLLLPSFNLKPPKQLPASKQNFLRPSPLSSNPQANLMLPTCDPICNCVFAGIVCCINLLFSTYIQDTLTFLNFQKKFVCMHRCNKFYPTANSTRALIRSPKIVIEIQR